MNKAYAFIIHQKTLERRYFVCDVSTEVLNIHLTFQNIGKFSKTLEGVLSLLVLLSPRLESTFCSASFVSHYNIFTVLKEATNKQQQENENWLSC